ncbi:ApeI family dehydratase, partial [Vibrio diabolicus]
MDKRKPTIQNIEVSDHTAELSLRVDADILDFQGHFSHFPLLPGVTQIDWALFYAVQYMNTPKVFKG